MMRLMPKQAGIIRLVRRVSPILLLRTFIQVPSSAGGCPASFRHYLWRGRHSATPNTKPCGLARAPANARHPLSGLRRCGKPHRSLPRRSCRAAYSWAHSRAAARLGVVLRKRLSLKSLPVPSTLGG